MDEKIKEIEELSTGIVEEYMKLLRPYHDEIIRLNSRIKELEKQVGFQIKNYLADHELMKEYRTKWEQSEARVKELEEGIEEGIEKFIDWLISATRQERIVDIPDEIWIPFTKLIRKEKP